MGPSALPDPPPNAAIDVSKQASIQLPRASASPLSMRESLPPFGSRRQFDLLRPLFVETASELFPISLADVPGQPIAIRALRLPGVLASCALMYVEFCRVFSVIELLTFPFLYHSTCFEHHKVSFQTRPTPVSPMVCSPTVYSIQSRIVS